MVFEPSETAVMPTIDEYRAALELAVQDGNDKAARQLAQNIAQLEREAPSAVDPFTEAARKRSAIEGSIADRERMLPPEENNGSLPLGSIKDLPANIARGVELFISLPGEAQSLIYDAIGIPEESRIYSFNTLEKWDELLGILGVDLQREDSVIGRIGQYAGGGGVGGIGNITRATSAAGGRGLAGSLTRNVGGSTASALGGIAGGNIAENFGISPMLGEILGSVTPQFAASAAGRLSGATQPVRARNSQQASQAMDEAVDLGLAQRQSIPGAIVKGTTNKIGLTSFKEADSAISAGIASPSSVVKFTERLLASVPGGMRIMHNFARSLNAKLNTSLQKITSNRNDIYDAGIHISRGVNNRINAIRTEGAKRYDRVARAVPEDQPVEVNRLRQKLDEIIGEKPEGVDEIISAIRASGDDALANNFSESLQALSNGGPITYKQADYIRRAIGREISNSSSLARNPNEAELKALYGALSDDVSASLTGQQKTLYDNASNYWKQGRATVDQILDPVIGGKDGIKFDAVFKRAFASGGESVSVLKEVYKGMTPAQREVATKTFIARMGKVGDEAIDAAGDLPLNPNFKMQTFITQWRKLPKQSKDIIFEGMPQLRKDMDTFSNYVNRVLETNAAFANPSQSGPVGLAAATAYLTLAGIATGATTGLVFGDEGWQDAVKGGVAGLGGVIATAKGAQVTARLMTNPAFVSWLARGTRVPVNKAPEHIGRLTALLGDDPQFSEDVSVFISALQEMTDIRHTYGPRVEYAE